MPPIFLYYVGFALVSGYVAYLYLSRIDIINRFRRKFQMLKGQSIVGRIRSKFHILKGQSIVSP